jgi:hypothetical protein
LLPGFGVSERSIYDVPSGGVPVYIAAGGPAVARYAGRAGDGFICTSGKGEELYTDKLMPAVEEGAAASDRDVDDNDKMIEIKISYDPDPQLALENTRFWAPLSLSAEQKHSIDDPIEMERAADDLPIEQVAKRWIVASDPDEAVEKVAEWRGRRLQGWAARGSCDLGQERNGGDHPGHVLWVGGRLRQHHVHHFVSQILGLVCLQHYSPARGAWASRRATCLAHAPDTKNFGLSGGQTERCLRS